LSVVRIELHRCGPIQLGLVTRNDAQWLRITARVQRIHLDRRRNVLAGTGNPEIAVMTPGIHKQEPVLLIDGNTVRGVQAGVVQPVEYTVGPQIVVLEDDFVGVRVERDRTIGRCRITDRAHWNTSSSRSRGSGLSLLLLRSRKISYSLLQRGHQSWR